MSWEVDPESKSKLQSLQHLPPNKSCIDCAAPSPQWASPKFGTFICLTCAGLHRSLGVHISFVRSVAMDSFKSNEVERMEKGGNARWREFWVGRVGGDDKGGGGKGWTFPGKGGDAEAKRRIEEVYGGDIGEEWKERLGCEVEGREFKGVPKKREGVKKEPGRDASPANSLGGGMGARSQKEMNEDFFAKKGRENDTRPAGLKPSEGGKYAGFGSAPSAGGGGGGGGGGAVDSAESMPTSREFQSDPLAAIGKGFGWFASTAAKGAKEGYSGWIQPGVQKIAEADIATQARLAGATAAKTIQTGTKGAAERFNNFIENEGGEGQQQGSATRQAGVEPEKKDFWDSFGEDTSKKNAVAPEKQGFWDSFGVGGEEKKGGSAIGTAAMRKGGGGGKDEGWSDW